MNILKRGWLRVRDWLLRKIYPNRIWGVQIKNTSSGIPVDELMGANSFIREPQIDYLRLEGLRIDSDRRIRNPNLDDGCCAPMDQGGFNELTREPPEAIPSLCGKVWLQSTPSEGRNPFMGYQACQKCGALRKHGDYVGDKGEHVPACSKCGDPEYFEPPFDVVLEAEGKPGSMKIGKVEILNPTTGLSIPEEDKEAILDAIGRGHITKITYDIPPGQGVTIDAEVVYRPAKVNPHVVLKRPMVEVRDDAPPASETTGLPGEKKPLPGPGEGGEAQG